MESPFSPLQLLNAIYRYRLVSLCAFVVGLTLTLVTVRQLPNVYLSTTLILVEPQNIPDSYVKATVSERLEKRLQAMNQEVLSRTRLEAIIKDLSLYPDLRAAKMPIERIVDFMRRKVQVQTLPSDNWFRISFEGRDPKTVQQVTARLASLYIDENLRIREESAAGTTEFMDSELKKAGRQLQDQETKIQAFKQQYLGELPEQAAANMRMLEGMQAQLQAVGVSRSAAQERKVQLERQASDARAPRIAPPGAEVRAPAADSPQAHLRLLESQLADLRSRYTEEHPDVVRAKSQIERLKTDLGGKPEDASSSEVFLPSDLRQALDQVRYEIKRLDDDEERLKKAIEVYRVRVENSFVREQEMQVLKRDYDVTQRKYQNFLDKKLEAQLSQSLEQRQKAERFRILDPAGYPESPSKPDRVLLVLGGVGLTLALALGLPILLWQLDRSYHEAEEFTAGGLPVLAVIPQVHTADVDRQLRWYRVRVLAASAAALVVGIGSSTFYAKYLF